ncbi:1-deoxy-D-xylulose-5-phosphate synthase [Nocardia sp. NPDC056100]|uniref:1-deoxy-D-xylulose-5-phosphate synthase n=1 Tax=Nocardia sp. NPDC056100 TaxID=3345712 RepID=UPI0035D551CF
MASSKGRPAGGSVLRTIASPADLRDLNEPELLSLCAEIRQHLIEKVCATGGHLGANLGVVELTVAAHRVFDSPADAIVYDTGHQTYVHKMLTGRLGDFDGLRAQGKLAGYPTRAESAHDWIENSHASTALAYADGLAKAARMRGSDRRVLALIGDGALTGGLAWEGLNNLSATPEQPVTVLLNDNGRSYDPTVGGLAHHLRELRADPDSRTPGRNLFEALGLVYLGPVDGHDVVAVENALRHADRLGRTVVVHCVTEKGRGYAPAEQDLADRMHAVGVIDPATGASVSSAAPSWTGVFGWEIAELGARHANLVCVTAAMLRPVGLTRFADHYPDRVFDSGIAEQHAVCSAAALAMSGLHPVVCLYATFLNRAFDQVLLDVALHRQPVTFVLDRAGITGPDGPSHHGLWDSSILNVVPGLRVAAPRDPASLRELLAEAVTDESGPTVLRFPKAAVGEDIPAASRTDGLDILHRSPRMPLDVLLVSVGVMATPAVAAAKALSADGIGVTVVDPRWISPITPALVTLAQRHRLTVTIEDAARTGGTGALLAQACADGGHHTRIRSLGLPREFIEHGARADLLDQYGLTAAGIVAEVHLGLGISRSAPVDSVIPANSEPGLAGDAFLATPSTSGTTPHRHS